MHRRQLLLGLLGVGACSCSRSEREREQAPTGEAEQAPADSKASSKAKAAKDLEPGPLGALDELPPQLRPAFSADDHEPAPARLAGFDEPAQSFDDFRRSTALRPPADGGAQTIAVLPIGEYPRGFIVAPDGVRLVRSLDPALLARFIRAWFGLEVRVLPALGDDVLASIPSRERDEQRQLDAAALLDWLERRRPEAGSAPGSTPGPDPSSDSVCVLALTLEDLYAEDAAWVFGYASAHARVAVHSMLRYDPGFPDVDARGPDFEQRIRARVLRVVAHEVAHMFDLRHCLHYACVMNPTAGLEDLDRLPLRLCPVCLRKLWTVTGLALVERWEQLAALADALALADEAAWYRGRLARLGLASP